MPAKSRKRLPRSIFAAALGALTIAACQAAPATTTLPTSPPATATTRPATPTPAPVALGTITLTDTECVWAGNPGSTDVGPATIQAWNETDDYASFFLHRLHAGKTWADGEENVAGVVAAIATGADWPPPVSDVVTEADAVAGLGDGLDFVATPGTYGVICSASPNPTGEILTVFLVGPLVVDP